MKRITRATLRGKPLDDDCRKYGRTDPYQYGSEDKRCFCTGIFNPMYEDIEDKCRECSAWNENAEPYNELYDERNGWLNDKKVVETMRKAIKLYKDGAIIEAQEELQRVVQAIDDFSSDN